MPKRSPNSQRGWVPGSLALGSLNRGTAHLQRPVPSWCPLASPDCHDPRWMLHSKREIWCWNVLDATMLTPLWRTCFFFHPLKIMCLHHIDGRRMWKNDDMVERLQFSFHCFCYSEFLCLWCRRHLSHSHNALMNKTPFWEGKDFGCWPGNKVWQAGGRPGSCTLKAWQEEEGEEKFRIYIRWFKVTLFFDPLVEGHPWKVNFPR